MDTEEKKYIAYYRKSPGGNRTKGDLLGSLSINSQKSIVQKYIGSNGTLIKEFTEVETGTKKCERPIIRKAIHSAKFNDATLVIANISRLARNLHFVTGLQESGVKFVCCDMPEADNFTIHIFAALAQKDTETISKNTKAALNELRKNGVKLGNPYKVGEIKKDGEPAKETLGDKARENSLLARRKKAEENDNNRRARNWISDMREKGMSFNDIAIRLNDNGFRTSKGLMFTSMQVSRLSGESSMKPEDIERIKKATEIAKKAKLEEYKKDCEEKRNKRLEKKRIKAKQKSAKQRELQEIKLCDTVGILFDEIGGTNR